MASKISELLLIQKFIYLLDDFHFQEYRGYLKNANAALSVKLVDEIRATLPNFDSLDVLCEKIYGGKQKAQKLSFNQLGSYSFKLSNMLALNYPAYLFTNFAKLQQLVNEGRADEACMLAQVMLDIAERTEDFQTQIMALKFLIQRAMLLRNNTEGLALHQKLDAALQNETLYISLIAYMNRNKHLAEVPGNNVELEQMKAFYSAHVQHSSAAIRIFSQYAYINCIYQFERRVFDKPEDSARVVALQKEIKNNPYVVFPFLTDIKGNVDFWALNSVIHLAVNEDWQPFEALSGHYDNVKFWNSFMNAGRVNLLSTAASRFLTRYHCFVHRNDYEKVMYPDDAQYLKKAIEQCEELLSHDFSDAQFDFALRTLKMIYGVLLILQGGPTVKKGIAELEAMLTAYQQINLQSSTGSIYFGLMVGYFAVKDYDKCFKTFQRFERGTKDKAVYQGNTIKIYAYYYLAKWLFNGSKQYSRKMTDLLKPFVKNDQLPRTVMELVNHFKMPVDVYYDPTQLGRIR